MSSYIGVKLGYSKPDVLLLEIQKPPKESVKMLFIFSTNLVIRFKFCFFHEHILIRYFKVYKKKTCLLPLYYNIPEETLK